jgi:hypothetical protein
VVEAQAAIDRAISSGMDAIRTLDLILANTFRDDRVAFYVWRRCPLIVEGRRRKRAKAPASSAA